MSSLAEDAVIEATPDAETAASLKVTMGRNQLLASLGHVRNIVERKTTIPILSNAMLSVDDAGLSIRVTDLERQATEAAGGNSSATGATTVPAHVLYDIIRKLPADAEVVLQVNGNAERLEIASGKSSFALPTLPPSNFPDLALGEASHSFEIGARDLKRLIEKTRFAVSTEETRYYLNGIFFHQTQRDDQQVLRAVSTDGHRLAWADTTLPEGADGMPGIILPNKTVTELHRLLPDDDSSVSIGVSTSRATFKVGSTSLASKLIDGTFPDYQRVVPRGNSRVLKLANEDFQDALERVSTIHHERAPGVKLTLTENQLVLSANSTLGGSAAEELAAEYAADSMEIGFNAKYLMEICAQIGGKSAEILLADPSTPIIVKDPDDESLLYVVMPMRV